MLFTKFHPRRVRECIAKVVIGGGKREGQRGGGMELILASRSNKHSISDIWTLKSLNSPEASE